MNINDFQMDAVTQYHDYFYYQTFEKTGLEIQDGRCLQNRDKSCKFWA